MEDPELCYELTQKMWGGDIATQAAQACLRYAFERVGLERMIAGADAPNITSLRVIEKLGMKHLGHITLAPRTNLTVRYAGRSSLRRR
jgi:RimJ/RimL family protein N-acetyltransferase